MKQKFSRLWRESKQPRKQRKYLHNLPLHLRNKQMTAMLDKELRKKYGRRNIELKKGDEVFVMRGKFKKKTGKITEVNYTKMKIAIEGIQNTKKEGAKVNAWIHPSKVKIKVLNLEDKKRIKENKEEKKNA